MTFVKDNLHRGVLQRDLGLWASDGWMKFPPPPPLENGPIWVEIPSESFASFSDMKVESG